MDRDNSGFCSVVIATYNDGRFLPQALESVMGQTHSHWEAIVVDDGSTDSTREIIKPYLGDERINYIYQENQGCSVARNRGLREVRGDYVNFLDADDLLRPTFLEKLLAVFRLSPEHLVDYCRVGYFIGESRERIIERYHPRFFDSDSYKIIRQNCIPLPSALIRREALERVGGFNGTLEVSEDWELWIRMALAGIKFHYLDEMLCLVRIHSANTMADWQRQQQAHEKFLSVVMPQIQSRNDPQFLREVRFMQALIGYQDEGLGLLVGDKKASRHHFVSSLVTLLPIDRRRLFKGIATFIYSFIPLLIRRKLSFLILPRVSPYYQ